MTKNSRFKVKRLHSRDRRRVYKAPSASENLCPFFSNTWALFKDRGYVPDYIAVCDNHTSDCDYRTTVLPGQLSLCGRYWKESWDGFVPKVVNQQSTLPRQSVDLYYRMIRLFRDKLVKLSMRLSRKTVGSYNWLHNQWNAAVPFTTDPSGKIPSMSKGNGSLISNENSSYLAGYYNKLSLDMSEYNFSSYFDGDDSDNDSIVFIFRYDPKTKNYYSVEWNNGGWDPKGLSINKNICTDPVKMTYQKETLAQIDNFNWSDKSKQYYYNTYYGGSYYGYYSNYISIKVTEDNVAVYATSYQPFWVPSHGHYHVGWDSRTLNAKLDDNRLAKGAYGIGTISQPNTEFTSVVGTMQMEGDIEVIDVTVPLSVLSDIQSGGKILTDTLENIFKQRRGRYLEFHNISRDELYSESYQIGYTDVAEGVTFEDGTKSTTDASNRIVINSWDYDKEIVYRKNLSINTNSPATITDKYYVAKDVFVKEVQVLFDKEMIEDSFSLIADRRTVFNPDSILRTDYHEYFDTEINPTTNSYITFDYNVESNPIFYYYNRRHIDTHQKIFKIRNNELGWHPIITGGESNE